MSRFKVREREEENFKAPPPTGLCRTKSRVRGFFVEAGGRRARRRRRCPKGEPQVIVVPPAVRVVSGMSLLSSV